MGNWYQYERLTDHSVRLLRVFGDSPEVVIPQKIKEMTVREIGAYCFSQTNRTGMCEVYREDFPDGSEDRTLQKLCREGKIRELCGSYIRKLVLPESVTTIGNLACYQCRELAELVVGRTLTGIGSDAFMNCNKLKKITILGSVRQASGLKQILGQRSRETEVTFCKGNSIEAVLLYPEYSESYDEIGPAHIFTLNIEGDGFRARQCFRDGIVDLAQYDAVFLQAVLRERKETLCYMALMRLYYPYGLQKEMERNYCSYLKEHIGSLWKQLVEEKNLKMLQFLVQGNYFEKRELSACIQYAVGLQWAEGVRELLSYRNRNMQQEAEDEYGFEEFE